MNRLLRLSSLTGVMLLAGTVAGARAEDAPPPAVAVPVYHLNDRLELFVDRHRISSMEGVELRLHPPKVMETSLTFDEPWEGPFCGYVTVFPDGDVYRMYYRGWPDLSEPELTCFAQSRDGIHWVKPNLGLFDFEGSTDNNIVWRQGYGSHNFTPFKDPRPGVPKDQKYKAFGRAPKGTKGLVAFASPDGFTWRLMSEEPVLTEGAFDSQNIVYWDPNKKSYVSYYRIFQNGVRWIAKSEKRDFLNWSRPIPLEVEGPPEHFYTNAIVPYFRAPHYYFAFPKRFVRSRKRLEEHSETGISEAVFLSSRDGLHFDRTFRQALIRPGRERRNWGDRSNMVAWGILQTADDEMSIYFSQHYRFDSHHLKRGVFRLDGIASVHSGAETGELVTKPFRFKGNELVLNYATSASGSIRVELQTIDGDPIPGFSLDESTELFGDEIAEAYSWNSDAELSKLAGKPVRLRFVLQDADLYSYRFRKAAGEN